MYGHYNGDYYKKEISARIPYLVWWCYYLLKSSVNRGVVMYIKIKKFIYDGWDPTSQCFDKETYSLVDIAMLDSDENNMYYKRYVSLPTFDYDACEDDYINQLNNKVLYSKYKRDKKGFSHFVDSNRLFYDWYKFQTKCFYENVIQWCENNDIIYSED